MIGSLVHGLFTGPVLLGSPLYVAWNQKFPAAAGVQTSDGPTSPLLTTLVPSACTRVVQVLLLYTAYDTVPIASAVAPTSVAWSWTGVPIATGPGGVNSVVTLGVFGLTVIGSLKHALDTGPVLFGSPLYVAWNQKFPAAFGVNELDGPTVPFVTGNVPRSCTSVVHVLFEYTA